MEMKEGWQKEVNDVTKKEKNKRKEKKNRLFLLGIYLLTLSTV